MKLKHKLPLISILLLIVAFVSLWFGTQSTAFNFTMDYQYKMSLLNIERHTKDIEYSIKNGKHQLWNISQKLEDTNLNWQNISSYFYDELDNSVFDKIGLVYKDKTYNITGSDIVGDLSDREYLDEAFEGKTTISDPIHSNSDGTYQMVIAIPINYNYEVVGVVIGTIPMENIEQSIYSLNIEGHGYGMLINKYGKVILHPRSAEIPYDNFFDYTGINNFTGKNGFIQYEDFNKIKKYGFFKELEQTELFAVISINQSDLYSPITKLFTQNFKIFAFVLILLLFITNIIIKNALKPINILIDGMKKAEEGEYTLQVPADKVDEIGHIAIQFNKTIEAISFRDEELQALNEELATSFEEIHATSDKLLKSYFDIIRALVKAMELKDTYTKGHSERVMEYSLMLGEKINLASRELEILRHGSILHDIGKLGIPDNVLLKADTLDDEEYNLIKKHPEKGEAFIGNLEFLQDCLQIIRNHHERMDGMGYPDGVKEDEIPQLVKIVTIADSYDAMTTKRAYKKPLNKKDAINELVRCKGSQFDPYLVDQFIEVIS